MTTYLLIYWIIAGLGFYTLPSINNGFRVFLLSLLLGGFLIPVAVVLGIVAYFENR